MSDIEARIEELAKIAYGVKGTLREGSWATLQPFVKDTYRAIARTLYAEAMKDAAGVAWKKRPSDINHSDEMGDVDAHDLGASRMAAHIATAIEALAKEPTNA
jgi:hypothetical protein